MMRQAWTPATTCSLRSIGSGGETLGADTLAWARDALGITINEFYGQTEVNLVVGNCAPLFDPVPGSMGRAYAGHRVEVLGPDGSVLGPGEDGEICVSDDDPAAFLGYWNRPDATAEKVRNGWISTGDVGVRDDRGFFWYNSRADDVISSSGYRIGPSEIELCLNGHEAVRLSAAIGVPDAIRGEVVKAFVELLPGHQPSDELAADIQRHVRDRLASYLYPRKIEFVDAIPLTTTGKVRRSELRAREREKELA
jgi:acetyl-CoA synthetase